MIMNHIAEMLLNVFEVYIIYRYMTIFFGNHVLNKRVTFMAYVIRYAIAVLYDFIVITPLISAIIAVLSLFFVASCYSSNTKKKLIVTIIVYMCFFMGESVVALGVGISGFNPCGIIIQRTELLGMIMLCVTWFFTLVVKKFKNIGMDIQMPKVFVFALVVIAVSLICLNVMVFQEINVNRNMANVCIVCSLCSIFVMIYLSDSISKTLQQQTQAALILREKEYFHEQAELLKRRQEELRQFRHDMKNRFVAIQQMLDERKVEEVLGYTGQIIEKLGQLENYSETGCLSIDGIINYKMTRASQKGIVVDLNIVVPKQIEMEDDDIVIILGNIIDNAIEATEQLKGKKYICLNMEYEKGCIYICIKNNYDSVTCLVDGKLKTRKNNLEMHGIGLQSVNTIVEKYNGILEIERDDKEFVVNIFLYV